MMLTLNCIRRAWYRKALEAFGVRFGVQNRKQSRAEQEKEYFSICENLVFSLCVYKNALRGVFVCLAKRGVFC
jgi:hypothetical protein